jgi:hypothetical protein
MKNKNPKIDSALDHVKYQRMQSLDFLANIKKYEDQEIEDDMNSQDQVREQLTPNLRNKFNNENAKV